MGSVVCVALLRYYNLYFGGEYNQSSYHDRYLFGVITIGGMILITAPIFLAHIFGSEISPGLDLIYSVMGFVLFLTAGILALDYYSIYRIRPGNLNAGRSLGAILVINSFFSCSTLWCPSCEFMCKTRHIPIDTQTQIHQKMFLSLLFMK